MRDTPKRQIYCMANDVLKHEILGCPRFPLNVPVPKPFLRVNPIGGCAAGLLNWHLVHGKCHWHLSEWHEVPVPTTPNRCYYFFHRNQISIYTTDRVYTNIYIYIYKHIYIYTYKYISIYLSIDRSIDLSIYRSIDLSIYRPIDRSIDRSIDLSISLQTLLFSQGVPQGC